METNMRRHAKLDPEQLDSDDGRADLPPGHDVASLGPGDSSDTGADLVGTAQVRGDTSDREGTGERATVGRDETVPGADIGPDRVVGPDEAGLGGGLDQAEEANLGITDEQLQALLAGDDDQASGR
jgi:hypothetical protein